MKPLEMILARILRSNPITKMATIFRYGVKYIYLMNFHRYIYHFCFVVTSMRCVILLPKCLCLISEYKANAKNTFLSPFFGNILKKNVIFFLSRTKFRFDNFGRKKNARRLALGSSPLGVIRKLLMQTNIHFFDGLLNK